MKLTNKIIEMADSIIEINQIGDIELVFGKFMAKLAGAHLRFNGFYSFTQSLEDGKKIKTLIVFKKK